MFLVTNSSYYVHPICPSPSSISMRMWLLFPVSLVAAVFTLSVLEHPRGAGQCAVPRAGPGLLLASPDHEIVWSLAGLKLI